MPKVPGQASEAQRLRRHNPLSEDYVSTKPPKQKAGKKRKARQAESNEDNVVGAKATRRILESGKALVEEEEDEQAGLTPNPAFALASRITEQENSIENEERLFEDEDGLWEDEDEVIEAAELDPNDQDIFNRFHPSHEEDPAHLFNPPSSKESEPEQGTNLAELILAKIAAHEAAISQPTNLQEAGKPTKSSKPVKSETIQNELEAELPPKVVEVYVKVGHLLSRQRSGALPKPFKILPTLPTHQIPLLISLTNPDAWTPHVHFLATRLFMSSTPAIAQGYLTSILLPRVRDDIHETKKIHVHLYNALKKSLYKPAAFFKGFLFPLLQQDCTLREAHVVSSVLTRVTVPVLHSAAALLRLCDIAAEQFSTSKEDGGGGATNMFIRVLLQKKYALPYKVVDALVFHFLRFRALDPSNFDQRSEDVSMTGTRAHEKSRLPVLWHQSLLAFAQRYRNDITEDQREALLDLVNLRGHKAIGPEVRRELLEGRGRGIPEFTQGADVVGGDDTMMMNT